MLFVYGIEHTFYVSSSGSDSSEEPYCTSNNPCLTLNFTFIFGAYSSTPGGDTARILVSGTVESGNRFFINLIDITVDGSSGNGKITTTESSSQFDSRWKIASNSSAVYSNIIIDYSNDKNWPLFLLSGGILQVKNVTFNLGEESNNLARLGKLHFLFMKFFFFFCLIISFNRGFVIIVFLEYFYFN
jgi:hypothetical protein